MFLTHLFDDGENPRLALLISVGADAEVDLGGVLVGLVGGGEGEDAGGANALQVRHRSRWTTGQKRQGTDASAGARGTEEKTSARANRPSASESRLSKAQGRTGRHGIERGMRD